MDCSVSMPFVGMMVGCILASLAAPAKAVVLFENPFVAGAENKFWCDPCTVDQPGPNGGAGGRVWDSFTLTGLSTLHRLTYFGLPQDNLQAGVNVEIAYLPYTSPIFSAHYGLELISIMNVNAGADRRQILLPDIVLDAGKYWLTIYGVSTTYRHTWRGQFEPNGDNSLLQFGPDPDHPNGFTAGREDARFQIDGTVNPVPLPAALPLYGTGLGVLAFLAWRRKRKAATV